MTTVSTFGLPGRHTREEAERIYREQYFDVHKYRLPIASDCIVGCCSMNNCLYPDCSATYRALNNASRLV